MTLIRSTTLIRNGEPYDSYAKAGTLSGNSNRARSLNQKARERCSDHTLIRAKNQASRKPDRLTRIGIAPPAGPASRE